LLEIGDAPPRRETASADPAPPVRPGYTARERAGRRRRRRDRPGPHRGQARGRPGARRAPGDLTERLVPPALARAQGGCRMMTPHALEAMNGDVVLAGTVWLPANRKPSRTGADAPRFGAVDRDNDVLFRPIRERFLDVGVAVTSFDKRGVGESGGSWLDAGIEDQAADLRRSVDARASSCPTFPSGCSGTARAAGSCSRPREPWNRVS